MSRENPVNIPASITAKLHNLARQNRWNYNYLMLRYANERFLYRLSISPYSEKFILKGSSLFIIWQNGNAYRHTMDADLLCFGQSDDDSLKRIFADICSRGDCTSDGMTYEPESVAVEPIRIDNEYGGTCVTLNAFLGNARLVLQFDIGIGDAITPAPEKESFPVLLNGAIPVLRTYPKATVIAEKTHAMVSHGEQNSRMKDFADLYTLASEFEFEYQILHRAMFKTFERRRTPVPNECPFCFTDAFAKSPVKQTQWAAFLRKNSLTSLPADFSMVIKFLSVFLMPLLNEPKGTPVVWHSKNGWQQ